MYIADLERDDLDVRSDLEIECALEKRNYLGMNEFRLFHSFDHDHPLLIIKVNAGLAWLYYIKSSEHAGFHSMGEVSGLDPSGVTHFVTVGPQDEWYLNDQVVPFSLAVQVAKQFFAAADLPKCVKWFELE